MSLGTFSFRIRTQTDKQFDKGYSVSSLVTIAIDYKVLSQDSLLILMQF